MNDQSQDIIGLDPLTLRARDTVLAQKAMSRLALGEQIRYVLAQTPDNRIAAIELSSQAAALVAALPEQAWWMTLRDVDRDGMLLLLEHAAPAQIQFGLDVECWRGDQWQFDKLAEWLAMLAISGEARVISFFEESDMELLGLLLKHTLTIYHRQSDEDIASAIPWPREESPFTLDGVYYFQVAQVDLDQVLRPMLECYAKHDHEKFLNLIDNILVQQVSELENLAYDWRGRRLAEHGFPAWDEAVAIYRRLRAEEFDKLPRRTKISTVMADDDATLTPSTTGLILAASTEDLLIARAIAALDDTELRDACVHELLRIANRVLIADKHDIAPDALQNALQKTVRFANLGLEIASGGGLPKSVHLLTHHWLTHLFQLGFSRVMSERDAWRARLAQTPLAAAPDDPADARAIAHERVMAATWEWPKFYIGPHTSSGILHRDFSTLADFADVQNAYDIFST